MKNWLKILISASLFLGFGHCCRHGKTLNFKALRFSQSNNTIIAANYTPSVFEAKMRFVLQNFQIIKCAEGLDYKIKKAQRLWLVDLNPMQRCDVIKVL